MPQINFDIILPPQKLLDMTALACRALPIIQASALVSTAVNATSYTVDEHLFGNYRRLQQQVEDTKVETQNSVTPSQRAATTQQVLESSLPNKVLTDLVNTYTSLTLEQAEMQLRAEESRLIRNGYMENPLHKLKF